MLTDRDILKSVTDELAFAPDVAEAGIRVTVHNGVVTLLGHVPSFWGKDAATRATRAVRGVRGIAEELTVSLSESDRQSDEKIAAGALFCLASDVSIPNDLITVTVENGVVTLTGEVGWHYQREEAAFAIRRIAGVTELVNQIRLKPRQLPDDVVASVTQAFARGGLDPLDRITVKVHGGEIRLGGSVHSPHQRAVAETATWSVPGVTQVENTIGIS
ncbi:BON domain-containing protein [Bosea sp. R86505]|uniref:BON domain-containing protein n=1 Tax=Bosea sp. R86505 TaxID=3101710 RepID=UPI00366E0469